MNTKSKNLALLPSGFVDLLPPDAEREAAAIGVLMGHFAGFGYDRVKPPLLEFEESLFAPGPGAAMADQTFRLMDPVSHRMMGVRSDITPQIARIASSRLAKDKRPLRVCYANDVLRTKASQQRTERQFTQVGCEIIGEKNIEADIEACVVALTGLNTLGVKNITIDLAWPEILRELLDKEKIHGDARLEIKNALERRAIDKLKLNKNLGTALKNFLDASGPAEKALKKLDAMNLKGAMKDHVRDLKAVYEGIARALNELKIADVQITIDPVETRGFKYYSGIGFTIFAKNTSGELGRGGRYDINTQSATGFTLYMDTVRKSMPAAKDKKTVQVGYNESWAKIKELQLKGSVVVRGKA